MFEQVYNHFLWGMAYSIAGWIWEVILFCFTAKKFINRGFVYGPVCPIYGAGALAMWGIFGVWLKWANIFALFFLGGLLACVMEYIIAYALEKLFHRRWWDYDRNRFNLHGRVCLLGFTAFGVFCVLVVRWVQPFIIWVTSLIPDFIVMNVAIVIVTVFGLDLLVTVGKLCKLDILFRKLLRKYFPVMNVAIVVVTAFGLDLLVTIGKRCKLDILFRKLLRKYFPQRQRRQQQE